MNANIFKIYVPLEIKVLLCEKENVSFSAFSKQVLLLNF